jgi:hypothetical protein
LVGGRSYLFQPPREAVGPFRINPGFPGLSGYQGWVTHVLLTRSPLSPEPKPRFSLDLHVLSAPPAFVLSQDQTLREEWLPDIRSPEGAPSRQSFHFELVLFSEEQCSKAGPEGPTRSIPRPALVHRPLPVGGRQASASSRRIEERSLLSFQRPVPRLEDGAKKASDSRQRPPRVRIVPVRVGPGGSLVE